jgi:hypothetical protein
MEGAREEPEGNTGNKFNILFNDILKRREKTMRKESATTTRDASFVPSETRSKVPSHFV